jgi:DNA-binding response OmpR family regulator
VRTTVLILDNDLGFVFWLGRTLDAAGYQTLPAKNISDATILLEELTLEIDLLIVNPSLPGAAEFVSMLRRSTRRLKVIAISDVDGPVTTLPGVDAWRRKPDNIVDEVTTLEWVQLTQSLLADNAVKY